MNKLQEPEAWVMLREGKSVTAEQLSALTLPCAFLAFPNVQMGDGSTWGTAPLGAAQRIYGAKFGDRSAWRLEESADGEWRPLLTNPDCASFAAAWIPSLRMAAVRLGAGAALEVLD